MTKLLSILLVSIWLLMLLALAAGALMARTGHEADGKSPSPTDDPRPDSHATGSDGQTSELPASYGMTVPALSREPHA